MKTFHHKSETLYLILFKAGMGTAYNTQLKIEGIGRYRLYHPLSDLANENSRTWIQSVVGLGGITVLQYTGVFRNTYGIQRLHFLSN